MNIPLRTAALLAALTAATSVCAGSSHHPQRSAGIRSVPASPVLNQPSPNNRPSNYGASIARAAPVPVPATTQQLEKNLAACMRAGRC
jgi:hypothetical protein